MFNLLVSGKSGAWEADHLDMDLDRFNTYSGKAGRVVNIDDPDSLGRLEGTTALVMYEIGVDGPNADIVRHGRLRNVARYGQVVSCEIELDLDRPYLPREKIVEFERHLDMDRFEQGRTHWAIKDGDLPPALLKAAAPKFSEKILVPVKAQATLEDIVDGIAVLPQAARVVAVVVGLEDYRQGVQQIAAVDFAKADAIAFQQAIERVFVAHRPEIQVLINDQATHADLVNAIAEKAYGVGPDDLFIFYYAGHGFHDDSGNRLTVWDTSLTNVEGTTVSVDDKILGPLRRSECQRVLAFVDACASKFKPLGRKAVNALDAEEFGRLLKSAIFNAVFLSCRAGEQSFPDKDLEHGIWTYYLLRALNGEAPEAIDSRGFVTNATLQDYLRQEVPRHLAKHPRISAVQTPEAIVAATSTFAIRRVDGPQRSDPPPQPASSAKVPVPDHARYSGSSTEFFARRFARAFPGIRTLQWFDDKAAIQMRLLRLLEAPLTFDHAAPIWWWRNGNLQIESFSLQSNGLYLMDQTELDIRRIAAVPGRASWQSFVYVETAGLPPCGAYEHHPEISKQLIEDVGYIYEEYGLVDGRYAVTRGEYDDGSALVDGELQDIHHRSQLRFRHLTPYNFLIAAHESPINNTSFDRVLVQNMNMILIKNDGIEDLAEKVFMLRQPRRKLWD